MTDYKSPLSFLLRLNSVRLGLFLIAFVWLFDPIIDSYLLKEGTLSQQLFSPEPIEIYFRLIITILLTALVIFIQYGKNKLQREINLLEIEQIKLKKIIQVSPECVKTVLEDGTLENMNSAGLHIIEADTEKDVFGKSVYDLIAPEDRDNYILFNERIFLGKSEKIIYDIIGLKGTRKTVESHAVPVYDNSGRVATHLAITRDITESQKLNEKLNYQATHDILTGLLNRHEFERRINNAIQLSQTDHVTHALLFIDLDQFKVVNDTSGHLAGDQLLTECSRIFKENIRIQDSVARMGGDEFTILLHCCSTDEAKTIAEKIRHEAESNQFIWEQRQYTVTTSIGVVAIDNSYQNASSVLRNADAACYLAKEKGRNRVQIYQTDDDATAKHHGDLHWVTKIQQGIKEKRFVLYGQPMESLSHSGERHLELLLRYREDDGTIAPPGAFLPAAERFGLSPALDRFVVTTALAYFDSHPHYFDYINSFSINLSGLSMADELFHSFILQQLNHYPNLANKICFEITETAAISNFHIARSFISSLIDKGCRFALDDFGSGLSSFSYLKNFPVDKVKIDGTFIRNIDKNPIDLAMVKSINEISQLMGKQTIAEFVENDQIKRKLDDLNVNFAQGYGIMKPFPIESLTTILHKLDSSMTA